MHEPNRDVRRLTLYRDDSKVQVRYENVKTFFWTPNNKHSKHCAL
jgi:hypothetical protein